MMKKLDKSEYHVDLGRVLASKLATKVNDS